MAFEQQTVNNSRCATVLQQMFAMRRTMILGVDEYRVNLEFPASSGSDHLNDFLGRASVADSPFIYQKGWRAGDWERLATRWELFTRAETAGDTIQLLNSTLGCVGLAT